MTESVIIVLLETKGESSSGFGGMDFRLVDSVLNTRLSSSSPLGVGRNFDEQAVASKVPSPNDGIAINVLDIVFVNKLGDVLLN